MKFLNTTKRFLIVCVWAVSFLIAVPFAMAGGGGGNAEPGGNCSDSDIVDYQYNAPPYLGSMNIILGADDWLWVEGSAEQVGNSACQASVEDPEVGGPVAWMPFDEGEDAFSNLGPNDIRGACLEGLVDLSCGGFDKQDLVGVGNMTFGTYSSDNPSLDGQPFFTAKIVLMELKVK